MTLFSRTELDSSSHPFTSSSDKSRPTSPRPNLLSAIFPKGRRFIGWRFGTTASFLAALLILAINVTVTALVLRTTSKSTSDSNNESTSETRVITDGECRAIWRFTAGTNVVVNVLSSVLLGASNYCMQCLSAPKRREVSRAHKSRQWLDIGVPSVRNLRFISKNRAALWVLMALTSLPRHLL